MIDLNNVTLDVTSYPDIENSVIAHRGENPGCVLHPHWVDSCHDDYAKILQNPRFSALNWLGDGFPATTGIKQPRCDKAAFSLQFANIDTLDIQSGMYQFYGIADMVPYFAEMEHINVVEVGGGYGRLAMFFLAHFGKKCHYINIDYVPTSLTFSPQVIRQLFPDLKVSDTLDLSDMGAANYVSLPAWEISRLAGGYDVAINVHSFQEMHPATVDWYIQLMRDHLDDKGVLYAVNNPHESTRSHAAYDYSQFTEIKHQAYPFGADWVQIYGEPCLERGFIK